MKKILTIMLAVLIIGAVFYGAQSVVSRFNLDKNDNINNQEDVVVNNSDISIEPENIENIETQKQKNTETHIDNKQEKGFIEKVLGVVGIKKDIEQVKVDDNIAQDIKIKIIKKPLGEEPDWVKQVWIGLEIPVIKGAYAQKGGQEVVSGDFRAADNYATHANEALDILKAKNPDAEKWWRDNVDLVGVDYIAFDQSVCKLIGAD